MAGRQAHKDLLAYEGCAARIVQVQEGLKILEVVCGAHLIQGFAWERMQDIIPLS